jgi:CelD/BcsL family acetyltransferase involved in cellulose biosynthesis
MRNVEACTSRDQLADLAPFWDKLDTYLNAPFGSYHWILSCAETLATDAELLIPVIRENDAPIALAALVRPHGFLAAVRQLGVEDHWEPGDFNYRDSESLDLLARMLAEALRRAYRRRGVAVVRPSSECPFIDIADSENETTAKLSASLRGDLRRASRRAESIGAVSPEVHAPATEAALLPLWEESLKVEAAGWKGRSRTALQMNDRLESFYRSYADRASKQGILRILVLRIGSDAAATMIAIELGERLWVLKIGYDEVFARCSPGMLLMHEALRYAARQQLRSCEFLGSATDWTKRWTDCGRPMSKVFIYPLTVRGGAVFVRHVAEFVWRKTRRYLRGRP